MHWVVLRLNFGRKIHYKGNLIMLLASVAAIATACGAIWGLEKTDTGLSNIEQRTQTIATDLQKVSSETRFVVRRMAVVKYWLWSKTGCSRIPGIHDRYYFTF